MYLKLSAKIEVKSTKIWTFEKVSSVEITLDSESLTDTCVIKLPKKIKWQNEAEIPLKRGDAISVWLGYNGELELAFTGYIRTVGFKNPVVITCEDEMFRLKQIEAKKLSYKSVTLEKLLKEQDLGGRAVKVFGEQNIGQYRVTASTVAGLLGNLKENGIRSFFRMENGTPVLYCGVLFEKEKTHKYVFATGINITKDEQLEYQSAEDVRLWVKAISLQPNNKKIKVEVGDKDGEKRTIHAYNKTEKELKAWAEQELKRLKQDGLTGSFTAFGSPMINKLDNIAIKLYGDRKGIYQVERNVIKYDTGNGFRQEITIGGRAG